MSSLHKKRLYNLSRLFPNLKSTIILALRFIWVIVVIWCDFGAFFYSISNCKWPDSVVSTRPESGVPVTPTRVLLIADARLRNPFAPTRNSWFGHDPDLTYLRKSWSVASRLRPDVVMFLGDTLASSRHVASETEYDRYYHAFKAAFPRDASTSFYFTPGNNDIGLGDSFSKDARRFYEQYFQPLNQAVSIAGHQFVLLNAPGIVEEDYRRHAHGLTYDQWTPIPGGPIEFVRSISDQKDGLAEVPKILLSHIPLFRPSSKSCGPLREKGSIRAGAGHGYQSMLGKQTTEFLLKTLRPSVVFSADNRDYCEVTHETLGPDMLPDTVREVTVKSFSPSRHIRRPGFQLLSLVPPSPSSIVPSFADAPCQLPDTLHVFHSIYIPCLALTALVLLYLNIRPSRHGRRPSNLSPISLTRHRRLSPPPEPESAIWATRTPFKSRMQTSPTVPIPLSARIPSTKSVPSYRATPVSTPQDTPLLSPITLFPSGDEADVEEDPTSPSHYHPRRELHYGGGWQDEHDDDDSTHGLDRSRAHHAPYFLPPPSSQYARARRSFSWSFVFRGRRRRVTLRAPDWKVWWSRLSTSATMAVSLGSRRKGPKGRGFVWRFASDCVSVALPAVVVWAMIGWFF